ncbi:helix-turn-helix domain-containing protein [Streptomyces sp. DSM 41982]|uniref:Helix-turn-helix domain-containing protein n=1 Tax=Streptomyces evansiae TaxID=3075535 RepID=A0ABD5ECD9_9ACTN|nr:MULTISPECIES: helix-turn-helix domain-containing protein [unclassified Streptomyces]MDT0418880.1 helix-turn-helix domain-containing protein [Streptomyces sp. DSM 41982]SCD50908.1 Helix-turn-helix [Streptomyces sp. SolWspMP-sol7th]
MSGGDFGAIDDLLASVRQERPLPPPAERRSLREGLALSRAQLAAALGVSTSTVAGWEGGRDPSGETRERYGYFLDGARAKLAPPPEAAEQQAADSSAPAPAPGAEAGDEEGEDVDVLAVAEPCVLCGEPARHRVAGYVQHLDPAECHPLPADPAPGASPAGRPAPARGRTSAASPARPVRRTPGSGRPVGVKAAGRRARTTDEPGFIAAKVAAALAQHEGDMEAATAALVKQAIPDAMELLDRTRSGGRYDVVAHPALPEILHKQSAHGPDQIWEARPKWTRPHLPQGRWEVTALDINGAYLSALKTHLPLGQLEHSTGFAHDRRRAGVHLITPPAWDHDAELPNPLGARDEPGPLWVTEPTLRLLQRLAGPKYGLCGAPEIHESYTSGSTENLLEKFRTELKDARDHAITEDDEVTLEYVKAMYSKFVSTMGASNYNRELYRPDWMHLIRSQAFANLWMKALKAHESGLTVMRAMGTDELHVIGDWRGVFPEGRAVTEVKIKDTYSVGTTTDDETGE